MFFFRKRFFDIFSSHFSLGHFCEFWYEISSHRLPFKIKIFILIAKKTIFLPLLTHKSKCSLTHTSWLIFRWIYSLAIIRKQRFMNSDERKSRTFSMLCQCKCFNYQPLLFNQTWDRCPINVEPIEYLKWPQILIPIGNQNYTNFNSQNEQ